MKRLARFQYVTLLVTSIISVAGGCTEPVFQYVLNNWNADPYNLVVFHRGVLTAGDSALLKEAQDSAGSGGCSILNVNTDGSIGCLSPALQRLWTSVKQETLPALVFCYPLLSDSLAPFWTGPLTRSSLDQILSSPVRREIGKRIMRGDAIVWLLLSGKSSGKNSDKIGAFSDAPAHTNTLFSKIASFWNSIASWISPHEKRERAEGKVLSAALKKMRNELILDKSYVKNAGGKLNSLHPEFSLIRVSHDDPSEKVLVEMLVHADPALDTVCEPVAFPIFGRGRVLTALAGKDIQENAVGRICRFLAGPCACTVKGQNPGFDLFIVAPWYKRFIRSNVPDDSLQSLPGLSSFSEPVSGQKNAFREIFGWNPASESLATSTKSEGTGSYSSGRENSGRNNRAIIFHAESEKEPQQPDAQVHVHSRVLLFSVLVFVGVLGAAAIIGTMLRIRGNKS